VMSFAATTLDSAMRIQRILIGELGGSVEKVSAPAGKVFKNIFVQIILSGIPALWLANSRSIGAVWNLFGATNQLTACVSLMVVAVYVWRFRGRQAKYLIPFAIPIAFLLVMITWALIKVLTGYIEDCADESIGCDWLKTTPTYGTLVLGFLIFFLVLAVYAEIAFFVIPRALGWVQDEVQGAVDDDGKLEGCKLCEPAGGKGLSNIGCC